MPTARAPTGNERKSAPALLTACGRHGRTVGPMDRRSATRAACPTVRRSDRPSEMLRLIDQHDGNVVLDRVDQAAGMAYQLLPRRRAMLERALALGADENLQEVGRKAHPAYPRRLSDGWWRRHFGNTLTCSSRNTRVSSNASILARAAGPSRLMVRPPSPITIPFWLSRSTHTTARIYTGLAPSRNSSISTATL